ncbi:penicillin-binding protein 1F [Geobacter sp. OR-1]|nr:penicillin-binding protein 1F [Geobacter sp. OR-1]
MNIGNAMKRTAIAGLLIAIIIVAYYAAAIYEARNFTVTSVVPGESSAQYPLEVSSLTPRQLEILLKVEDPRFFEHGGVDFSTPGAGITTITQGLVKHLYFEKFTPGFAKIKQTLIAAYALDPLMSKQSQLRRFINTAYLGPKVQGFEQAANVYFHKPFTELNEDEYIAIVAMIIAPEVFDIVKHPARNQERVTRIKRLVRGEYTPRGLCDLYYGPLDAEAQKNVPPLSYFSSYYQ